MKDLNMNLVVLLFFLALAIRPSYAPIPQGTWQVHVVNGLSHKKILYLRCKSGDDDLGGHNITVGAEFTWKFKVDFFEKTLFWCYFKVRGERLHASLDVFWVDEDFYYKCNYKTCFWTAKDQGIYLKNIPESYDELRRKWEK